MKKPAILFALMISAMLTGCSPSQSKEPSQQTTETTATAETEATEPESQVTEAAEPVTQATEATEPATQAAEATEPATQAAEATEPAAQVPESTEPEPQMTESMEPEIQVEGQTATLYIGTKANGFAEYPMTYEGTLTPDALIQGIADLTGWNLTLAEPVISGKGGMSVCLSNDSSLFTGPPEPQNEEFFMYSAENLAETLLDSIQKTLQMGFTGEGGNPDLLDIWYFMEGSAPLEIPNIGLSWPLDQPYQWTGAISQ